VQVTKLLRACAAQKELEQEAASKAAQLEAAAARAAQLEQDAASREMALQERAVSAELKLADAVQRVSELEQQYAADADAAENRLWRRHTQRQLEEVSRGWACAAWLQGSFGVLGAMVAPAC
jgi:hypothetical protein